jgi:hypothetical protein
LTINNDEDIESYDVIMENLKISIKNNIIRDWKKCIWIKDDQSAELSSEVYRKIYVVENEIRTFANQVLITELGSDWNEFKELVDLQSDVNKSGNAIKKRAPKFNNIDVTLVATTIETLFSTIESKIYTEQLPGDELIQREIKRRIFFSDKLHDYQSVISKIKQEYKLKVDIWSELFEKLFDISQNEWQRIKSNFISDRNHVAHNKPLDLETKNKMLEDIQEMHVVINDAFTKYKTLTLSEEEIETLYSIQEQKEQEKEYQRKIIESEAGVSIRNRKEIFNLFNDEIDSFYIEFSDKMNNIEGFYISENKKLKDVEKRQLVFSVESKIEDKSYFIYTIIKIDESDGEKSTVLVEVENEEEQVVYETTVIYTNGEGVFNSEQSTYLPSVKDEVDFEGLHELCEILANQIHKKEQEYREDHFVFEEQTRKDWEAEINDMREDPHFKHLW